MTGGGFSLPVVDDDDLDGDDDIATSLESGGLARPSRVEWVGKPLVAGAPWMRLPLLTVGMLGLQCVWSIEMGYASPWLLELGLSKSMMSLVFVAGPLSGLIVQPLIGILADRSRSRFGRRRPFMLAGCVISIVAMMLLGWVREVAGWFGGGATTAIWLAVWAIYLIDFSINAVQATDRALVVDVLPPSQQEAGNAWAGRMFGTGSLAGFFVGNINLLAIFPFLGKTQLQVLSFLTSVVLMATHGLTAYSVKERVLLRDNRPKSTFRSTLQSIWTNIFTLPPAIRSICNAQFFAWIGWFPVLFYTSVWVGEIYVREQIANGRSADDPTLQDEATRAGSRALFLNACVNLVTSVFFPFLVEHSGIRRVASAPARDAAVASGDLLRRLRLGNLSIQLPIPGFTLIQAWTLGQAVFFATMMATYFASSVASATTVIALNGFCWAVAQWAPFSLLGEWILLDAGDDVVNGVELDDRLHTALADHEDELALLDGATTNGHTHSIEISGSHTPKSRSTPGSSRRVSRESPRASFDNQETPETTSMRSIPLESGDGVRIAIRQNSNDDAVQPRRKPPGQNTAEKAGVILGIHNIFIVLPQFLVTFLSSIIFYLLEPTRPTLPGHANPNVPTVGNITLTDAAAVLPRELSTHVTSSTDSVGLIFRIGGISAGIAGYLCWKMSRDWAK